MPETKTRWDIFCTVVDNFGDIGVTWRLARQLVTEHSLAVRLWVDDLRAFERLCPQIDIHASQQWQQGVEVRQWMADWQPAEAADVVIAAFACQLPSAYMEAMAEREKPPLWMNLDYLSAEDWVVSCHGLPSVKYKQVQKFFSSRGSTRAPVACCVKAVCWSGVSNFNKIPKRNDCSFKAWESIVRQALS